MALLESLKDEFANAFIQAVSSKSLEDCEKLIISYDEQDILNAYNKYG